MWLDAAAASARPPAGIVASSETYGLLGGRVRLESASAGALQLFGRAGRGGSGENASWLEGSASWELGRANRHFAWGAGLGAFGLDYRQPFDYRAAGASFEPSLSLALGHAVLALRGDVRHGRWRLGTNDTVPGDSSTSGRLGVDGAALTLGGPLGPLWLEAGAETYKGALDGWFSGGSAALRWTAGHVELGVSGRAWSTPAGDEAGVNGMMAIAFGRGVELRAGLGRDTRDPLYGTPGSFGGSLALSVRLAHAAAAPTARRVVELGEARQDGRVARFRLHAPRAHSVGLAGDFTEWRPLLMAQEGEDWTLELAVEPGVHHFAFLLDGREWIVPREAPGIATDEWGRKNATLVIEM